MKAIHLIAAGAALTLAACSNDEMVQAPEATPIGFDSYIGKTTRADDATFSNVKNITVYGYLGDAGAPKLFDGQIVSNSSGSWQYSPLQYWTAGKNYLFTAVASPASSGDNHYSYAWDDDRPTDIENFYGSGTIGFDNSRASGNEDLIYAFKTATTPSPLNAAPGIVSFSFKHALSRVKFTFKNAMASDAYSIKVYDLNINNAAATGSLVLGAEKPVWTVAGSTALELRSGYFRPATGTAANTQSVASGTKFIIPETKALSISFKIDLIVSGNVIGTYSHIERVLPSVEFQNGYSYNFVAEITPKNIDPDKALFPILFDVTEVEGWKDAADTHVTFE